MWESALALGRLLLTLGRLLLTIALWAAELLRRSLAYALTLAAEIIKYLWEFTGQHQPTVIAAAPPRPRGPHDELLAWVRAQLGEGHTSPPQNWHWDWQDGTVLLRLVLKMSSNLGQESGSDEAEIRPGQPVKNINAAFKISRFNIGVSPTVTIYGVTSGSESDNLKRYIEELRRAADHDIRLDDRRAAQQFYGGKAAEAVGGGLHSATCNHTAQFTIRLPPGETLDLLLEVRGTGGHFSQRITSRSPKVQNLEVVPPLSVSGRKMPQNHIPVGYRISGDSVLVWYRPPRMGILSVTVVSCGKHVTGSPFFVEVADAEQAEPEAVPESSRLSKTERVVTPQNHPVPNKGPRMTEAADVGDDSSPGGYSDHSELMAQTSITDVNKNPYSEKHDQEQNSHVNMLDKSTEKVQTKADAFSESSDVVYDASSDSSGQEKQAHMTHGRKEKSIVKTSYETSPHAENDSAKSADIIPSKGGNVSSALKNDAKNDSADIMTSSKVESGAGASSVPRKKDTHHSDNDSSKEEEVQAEETASSEPTPLQFTREEEASTSKDKVSDLAETGITAETHVAALAQTESAPCEVTPTEQKYSPRPDECIEHTPANRQTPDLEHMQAEHVAAQHAEEDVNETSEHILDHETNNQPMSESMREQQPASVTDEANLSKVASVAAREKPSPSRKISWNERINIAPSFDAGEEKGLGPLPDDDAEQQEKDSEYSFKPPLMRRNTQNELECTVDVPNCESQKEVVIHQRRKLSKKERRRFLRGSGSSDSFGSQGSLDETGLVEATPIKFARQEETAASNATILDVTEADTAEEVLVAKVVEIKAEHCEALQEVNVSRKDGIPAPLERRNDSNGVERRQRKISWMNKVDVIEVPPQSPLGPKEDGGFRRHPKLCLRDSIDEPSQWIHAPFSESKRELEVLHKLSEDEESEGKEPIPGEECDMDEKAGQGKEDEAGISQERDKETRHLGISHRGTASGRYQDCQEQTPILQDAKYQRQSSSDSGTLAESKSMTEHPLSAIQTAQKACCNDRLVNGSEIIQRSKHLQRNRALSAESTSSEDEELSDEERREKYVENCGSESSKDHKEPMVCYAEMKSDESSPSDDDVPEQIWLTPSVEVRGKEPPRHEYPASMTDSNCGSVPHEAEVGRTPERQPTLAENKDEDASTLESSVRVVEPPRTSEVEMLPDAVLKVRPDAHFSLEGSVSHSSSPASVTESGERAGSKRVVGEKSCGKHITPEGFDGLDEENHDQKINHDPAVQEAVIPVNEDLRENINVDQFTIELCQAEIRRGSLDEDAHMPTDDTKEASDKRYPKESAGVESEEALKDSTKPVTSSEPKLSLEQTQSSSSAAKAEVYPVETKNYQNNDEMTTSEPVVVAKLPTTPVRKFSDKYANFETPREPKYRIQDSHARSKVYLGLPQVRSRPESRCISEIIPAVASVELPRASDRSVSQESHECSEDQPVAVHAPKPKSDQDVSGNVAEHTVQQHPQVVPSEEQYPETTQSSGLLGSSTHNHAAPLEVKTEEVLKQSSDSQRRGNGTSSATRSSVASSDEASHASPNSDTSMLSDLVVVELPTQISPTASQDISPNSEAQVSPSSSSELEVGEPDQIKKDKLLVEGDHVIVEVPSLKNENEAIGEESKAVLLSLPCEVVVEVPTSPMLVHEESPRSGTENEADREKRPCSGEWEMLNYPSDDESLKELLHDLLPKSPPPPKMMGQEEILEIQDATAGAEEKQIDPNCEAAHSSPIMFEANINDRLQDQAENKAEVQITSSVNYNIVRPGYEPSGTKDEDSISLEPFASWKRPQQELVLDTSVSERAQMWQAALDAGIYPTPTVPLSDQIQQMHERSHASLDVPVKRRKMSRDDDGDADVHQHQEGVLHARPLSAVSPLLVRALPIDIPESPISDKKPSELEVDDAQDSIEDSLAITSRVESRSNRSSEEREDGRYNITCVLRPTEAQLPGERGSPSPPRSKSKWLNLENYSIISPVKSSSKSQQDSDEEEQKPISKTTVYMAPRTPPNARKELVALKCVQAEDNTKFTYVPEMKDLTPEVMDDGIGKSLQDTSGTEKAPAETNSNNTILKGQPLSHPARPSQIASKSGESKALVDASASRGEEPLTAWKRPLSRPVENMDEVNPDGNSSAASSDAGGRVPAAVPTRNTSAYLENQHSVGQPSRDGRPSLLEQRKRMLRKEIPANLGEKGSTSSHQPPVTKASELNTKPGKVNKLKAMFEHLDQEAQQNSTVLAKSSSLQDSRRKFKSMFNVTHGDDRKRNELDSNSDTGLNKERSKSSLALSRQKGNQGQSGTQGPSKLGQPREVSKSSLALSRNRVSAKEDNYPTGKESPSKLGQTRARSKSSHSLSRRPNSPSSSFGISKKPGTANRECGKGPNCEAEVAFLAAMNSAPAPPPPRVVTLGQRALSSRELSRLSEDPSSARLDVIRRYFSGIRDGEIIPGDDTPMLQQAREHCAPGAADLNRSMPLLESSPDRRSSPPAPTLRPGTVSSPEVARSTPAGLGEHLDVSSLLGRARRLRRRASSGCGLSAELFGSDEVSGDVTTSSGELARHERHGVVVFGPGMCRGEVGTVNRFQLYVPTPDNAPESVQVYSWRPDASTGAELRDMHANYHQVVYWVSQPGWYRVFVRMRGAARHVDLMVNVTY